ncbi:autotransporter domain-containing protein [Marinobacter oulmenensis]|uniref:Autotransporter-associated beta strand protein n=1 Tax=Marinobacter oulmenensis TaxID=643747 RepID=A0A840UKM2_9GAMM|nr:autotransporter domain-containing protein [Marinobacter oulmenensis]MBB5321397.1 autotransporter-associated beta strand protein [Marinobacter oulmenensis]
MNHVYRVVFNRRQGRYQAVSELATGRRKSAGGSRRVAGVAAIVAVLGASPAFAAEIDITTSSGTDGANPGESGTAAYGAITTDGDTYNLGGSDTLTGGSGAKGAQATVAQTTGGTGGAGGDGLLVNGGSNVFNLGGAITGGAGGAGGDAPASQFYAGSAGAAGSGLRVEGSDNQYEITGSVTGGRGGTGGYGVNARNGGVGAAAVLLNGTGNTVSVNGGTLTGGDGGDRGSTVRAGGMGGSAVQFNGSNNRLITNSALSGGSAGVGGATQSNAIQINGEGNTVELRDGYTFSGDVVVQSGTHTLALGGTTTSGSFDVSRLTASEQNGDGVTQFVGFSTLEKAGSGTWTLSGTRGDSNATLISGGTLVGSIDSLGNGDIENNGTLDVSQVSAGTYTGDVTGTGSLTKSGAGTLALTGANTHSGGTTISAGTLAIGNGGTTGSLSGDVLNNSALAFNRSNDLTFAGDISGTGSLTQAGSGLLELTGASTYSGTTDVDAGTLAVNGSLANSQVAVNNGGTLMGAGTIGGLDLASGGTLAPGNSIDTLTVDGDVTFESGSVFEVEVEAGGTSDVLAATGTATINGGDVAVQASESGTWSQTTSFSILTADGGVSGEFDGVTSNLAFLTPTLSYNTNSVDLTLERNDVSFSDMGRNAPETAVAGALQAIYQEDSSALDGFFPEFLGMSDAQAERAIQTLNGSSLASLSRTIGMRQSSPVFQHFIQSAGASMVGSASAKPVYLASTDNSVTTSAVDAVNSQGRPDYGLWLETSGIRGDVDASRQNYGYDTETESVSVGFDFRLPHAFVGGVALSQLSTDVEFDTVNDDQEMDQTFLTLSLQQQRARLRVSGLVSYGRSDIDTRRRIELAGSTRSARGETDGSELYAYAEAAYDIEHKGLVWQPVVGLSAADVTVDGFSETGAGSLNLSVEEQDRTSVKSRLGGRARFESLSSPFAVELSAFWNHEFADSDNAVSMHFREQPTTVYTVEDGDRERDSLEWGASGEYYLNDYATLTARIGGSQSSHASWLGGALGVSVNW